MAATSVRCTPGHWCPSGACARAGRGCGRGCGRQQPLTCGAAGHRHIERGRKPVRRGAVHRQGRSVSGVGLHAVPGSVCVSSRCVWPRVRACVCARFACAFSGHRGSREVVRCAGYGGPLAPLACAAGYYCPAMTGSTTACVRLPRASSPAPGAAITASRTAALALAQERVPPGALLSDRHAGGGDGVRDLPGWVVLRRRADNGACALLLLLF